MWVNEFFLEEPRAFGLLVQPGYGLQADSTTTRGKEEEWKVEVEVEEQAPSV